MTAESFTLTVHVEAMDCPVERNEINDALKKIPGIVSVSFDMAHRNVSVKTMEKNFLSTLLSALTSIGYEGVLVDDATEDNAKSALSDTSSAAITIHVQAMDCPVERNEIEAAFKKIRGIESLSFDMTLRNVTVATDGQVSLSTLLGTLTSIGYEGVPVREQSSQTQPKSLLAWRLGLGLILAAGAELLELTGSVSDMIIAAIAIAAILLAGLTTIKRGLLSLVHGHLNMTVLMTVAVTGALLLSNYPEAAMVMVLFEIGEAIESRCNEKARSTIRTLLDKTPKETLVKTDSGWEKAAVSTLLPGQIYRTEPGEALSADGILIDGRGSVDESMITGESALVEKTSGDSVWAGSICADAMLTVRATQPASRSMTARILETIEKAEEAKAPMVRFIDKFAQYYTPAVFVLALFVAVLGIVFTSLDAHIWIYRSLALLVIACPCALVISTPVSVVSALAAAAKKGIISKGGIYLEEARTITKVALDKTGTITEGKPSLTGITLCGPVTEEQALTLAGALANANSHPVSLALTAETKKRHLSLAAATEVKALPGYGMEGKVNGALLRLTSENWLKKQARLTPEVEALFLSAKKQGLTTVALSDFFGVIAIFQCRDTIKPTAKDAIEALKNAGITPYLLTGDTEQTARSIGQEAGIENIHAGLLPEDKFRIVDAMDKETPTAMAGDGINDAPALARARIGFAMGIKGTDSTLEAADVALMDDNVSHIAWFKRLSVLTHHTMIQNVVFAITVKVAFMIAALCGYATMWMAVFADTGVCLLVVAWAMRLLQADRILSVQQNNRTN